MFAPASPAPRRQCRRVGSTTNEAHSFSKRLLGSPSTTKPGPRWASFSAEPGRDGLEDRFLWAGPWAVQALLIQDVGTQRSGNQIILQPWCLARTLTRR